MIPEDRWLSMESRLGPFREGRWEVTTDSDGQITVRVTPPDGEARPFRATRDSQPAGMDDVRFLAHAPGDLRRLLSHVRGKRQCTPEELDEINHRASKASCGPWRVFLKSEGGIGGDSVIWVSDDDVEPDLYLWLGTEPAPDIYFDVLASARQDIPELLREIQRDKADLDD